jgi:hypothetical protein
MHRSVTTISALVCVVVLAGCGVSAGGRGRVDDQRARHVTCMRNAGLTVVDVGQTDLRVGGPPNAVNIHFDPSPGSSQQGQIAGQVQAAEVIGNALVYPGYAADADLTKIENCLAIGVTG